MYVACILYDGRCGRFAHFIILFNTSYQDERKKNRCINHLNTILIKSFCVEQKISKINSNNNKQHSMEYMSKSRNCTCTANKQISFILLSKYRDRMRESEKYWKIFCVVFFCFRFFFFFFYTFFSLQFRYSDSNAILYESTPVEMTVRNICFNVWRMASQERFGLLFKCAHTILRKSQSLKSHNITVSFNMVFWRHK